MGDFERIGRFMERVGRSVFVVNGDFVRGFVPVLEWLCLIFFRRFVRWCDRWVLIRSLSQWRNESWVNWQPSRL